MATITFTIPSVLNGGGGEKKTDVSASTLNDEFTKIQAKNDEINFYSGMFDFSDDGKRSTLFGLQHQNEELFRESFLGTLSPHYRWHDHSR